MSKYVIHHWTLDDPEADRMLGLWVRPVGRIVDGMTRSEYFNNPDRWQFQVGVLMHRGMGGDYHLLIHDGTWCERQTLQGIRDWLEAKQPLPRGGRR
jgi:hypothetical protein